MLIYIYATIYFNLFRLIAFLLAPVHQLALAVGVKSTPTLMSLLQPARAYLGSGKNRTYVGLSSTVAVMVMLLPTLVNASTPLVQTAPPVTSASLQVQKHTKLNLFERSALLDETVAVLEQSEVAKAAHQGARNSTQTAAMPVAVVPKPAPAAPVNQLPTVPFASYGNWSSPSQKELVAIITRWASVYGQDANLMVRVGMCESTLNNRAVGAAGELSWAQFMRTTFDANARRLGLVNADILNPEHTAQVMAWMWRQGNPSAWTCYRKIALGRP